MTEQTIRPVNPCTQGKSFCGQHGYDCPPPAVPAGQAPATDQTENAALWDELHRRDAETDQAHADAEPASVDRATVLREEAARIRAHCPDHLDADSAEGAWMDCHCAVADDMRKRANELRTAAKSDGGRVVAYRLGGNRGLCCAECAPSPRGDIWEPVTSDDLPDGGVCTACGVDVLIPPQPKEARP